MKFPPSAVSEAAKHQGFKPPSPKRNNWKKLDFGNTLPKARMFSHESLAVIRTTIPISTKPFEEKSIKDESCYYLRVLLDHLTELDPEICLAEANFWLDNEGTETKPSKRTPIQSLLSKDELSETDFKEFFETYTLFKKSKATVYFRFCIATNIKVPTILTTIKNQLRADKSSIIVENNKLPEIIDFCAGWLMGCDPKFLSTDNIHGILKNNLPKNTAKIPNFYVKKGTEYLWLNKECGHSKAPVVKIMCQGQDLASIRKIFSNIKCDSLFTKFIGNDEDLEVKWARLNDHIDEILQFRYIVMTGKEIDEYPDILQVKSDISEEALPVGQVFVNHGLAPYVQQSSNGKKIFAQCLDKDFDNIMEWLSNEVGTNSCCNWYIFGLKKQHRHIIKGKKQGEVPEILMMNNKNNKETWADKLRKDPKTSKSADSSMKSPGESTIATLKSQLLEKEMEIESLKNNNKALATDLAKTKELKRELELQKKKHFEMFNELKKQNVKMEAEIYAMRAQLDMLSIPTKEAGNRNPEHSKTWLSPPRKNSQFPITEKEISNLAGI